MSVEELGLTPQQLAELGSYDPALIAAWLEHTSLQAGLKRPAGFFLAGVRSGTIPDDLDDARRRRALVRAETLVRNLAYVLDSERELVEELFDSQGAILERFDSAELRARMLERWRSHGGRERPFVDYGAATGADAPIEWTPSSL